MEKINSLLVLLVIIGGAWAQSEPALSNVLDKLPSEYQGKVNETQLQAIANQSTAVFKEKCEKNGGPDVYPRVQDAFTTLPDCVKKSLDLNDTSVLQREIEAAKPNGAVDEVFKKYCKKTPKVKECLTSRLDIVKPCFTEKEKANLDIIYNVTEQLAEFICYKDGDRIALFIAEGGPECYQDNQEAIQDCVNATLGADYKFNSADLTANSLPEIKFEEKECKQLNALQTCVVRVLEKCKTPTSANIVEALFKFVRKATPCSDTPIVPQTKVTQTAARSDGKETPAPGAASGLAVTSLTAAAALVAAILL